jgi:hypothetical protein
MIQTPHLNPNGTTSKELLKQQVDAMSALIIAIEKLRQAGPNGRDYRTARPGALCKAQAEHAARLNHLEVVMRELDQIAQHIANSV